MARDRQTCSALARSIFHELEEPLFARLLAACSIQRFSAGETLCSEGDPARAAFCLEAGTVKLTRVGYRGDVQIIRLLGPTEVFGIQPLLGSGRFSVHATALEDVRVCVVPAQIFLELLRESKSLPFAVMRDLAHQVSMSEDILMALSQRSVKRRVADVLLLLNGHVIFGEDWKPLPPLRLKRREIAQMVSTTPETLSRVLAEFDRQGLIRVTRRDLELLDIEGLQTVSAHKPRAD